LTVWLQVKYSIGVKHSQRGVSPAPVVEDLQVLEQGVDELDPGFPSLPVEQFGLEAPPERLDHRVDVAVAD
jgi:hypothetical protein